MKSDISNFYCLQCFNKMPLPRPRSLRREEGHLKKIHCYKCKEEVNHYEVRDFDWDFSLDDLKQRVTDGEFTDKIKEEK